MDIYDGRYFNINKKIVGTLGLWPYANRTKNNFIRALLLSSMLIMLIPQVIRLHKYIGKDLDKMLENMFIILYLFGIAVKIVTAITAEEKMKIVYENTARDFETIIDENERNILIEYSERGRTISLGFIIYMSTALVVFITLPLTPIILDQFIPRLNQSRSRIYICNGDFLVDDRDYYYEIYLFDVWTCSLTVMILCSIDPMYAAIVEHCLALFAIVKYRLKSCTKVDEKEMNTYGLKGDKSTYTSIVEIIQLHHKIINFSRILEMSYTQYFLLEMGVTILILSTTSVIILVKLDQLLECIRYILILIGLLIHMFYLTWPSQKMIDYSGDLFQDTYLNEWYETSIRCQNLLKFMALRCMEPCQLTAGGLYVMNFINFASVVKTSTSYITLFSSFR